MSGDTRSAVLQQDICMADTDIRRSTFPASCAIADMAANIIAGAFRIFSF